MSDYFRIVRGLELDETIRLLQGAGAPGHTADTDDAAIGSVYSDNTTGALYTKTSAGIGPSRWAVTGGGGGGGSYALYAEYPVAPTPPAALGQNSVTIGSGSQTDANATNALAIGEQSLARLFGSMMYASGRFQSTGDAQAGQYILRTHTVNAAPTEAFLDGTGGSNRLVMPDDSTWKYTITVVGHRTDVADGHAGYKFEGVAYRMNGTGTIQMLGSPTKSVLAESHSAWDANVTTDAVNGSLKITMTGQAGKTIRWVAFVETVEVTN